jgi:hypothetical protein
MTAAVLAAALAGAAVAQTSVRVALPGVTAAASFEQLAKECYEAGLLSELPSESILDCSAVLEERKSSRPPTRDEARADRAVELIEDIIVVRHRLRFTALERQDGLSITAEAWTQFEEPDAVTDEPIASEEYAARLRDVLVAAGQRLRVEGSAPAPWAGRYADEQAWHLDAHLRAVRHCDTNLNSMRADQLGEQLASIGVWPLSDDVRDRCEQLQQMLLQWGLARGNTEPTLAEYARYRAALPSDQRPCTGRLALAASCR